MKYLFSLLFFICFSITLSAQVTTNVFWTEQSGLPAAQVIYYASNQGLKWPDFRAVPLSTGIVAAITMSGFGYTASMKKNGTKGEINIGIYCYFNKDKSWVKTDKKTNYILNHEQHHFDISYIAACLFANKIKATTITPNNLNSVLPRIYKECCDTMNKLQDDYDGETRNGQLKDIQEKWNISLAGKLASLTR